MEAFQERIVKKDKERSTRVVKLEDFIFDNHPLLDELNKKEKISTNPATNRDENISNQ